MLLLSYSNVSLDIAVPKEADIYHRQYCDGWFCQAYLQSQWRCEGSAAFLLVHQADRQEIPKCVVSGQSNMQMVGREGGWGWGAGGHRQPRQTSCTRWFNASGWTTVPRSLRSLLCRPQMLKASANNASLLHSGDSSGSNQDVGSSNTPSLSPQVLLPRPYYTRPHQIWWAFSREAQTEAVTSEWSRTAKLILSVFVVFRFVWWLTRDMKNSADGNDT